MKAVVYDFSVPKYLAAKAMGKRFPSLYYGKPSALSFKKMPEPDLPNEDWIKIKPIYSGLCGSDMGAIFYNTSPVLTPFNSFPSVMGHETVGYITEVGKNIKDLKVGQRVTVDPYINCEVRGIRDLCPACEQGLQSLCRNKAGSKAFGPGMILGFTSDLPGTWSEALVAHRSMVIPLPEEVSDKVGALFEPLSVGLHAVLRQVPKDGEHVLVIGGGMIAYTVIAAIRLLGIDCHITQMSLLDYQKQVGLRLGVNEGVINKTELKDVLLSLPQTESYEPVIGEEVYLGGFDSVFDCIGVENTVQTALDVAKERGKITLVGCAGEMKQMDWTFVWANELSIVGTHAYAKKEVWQDEEYSTQELLIKLIQENPDYPLEELITHEYPLKKYKKAIKTNIDREKYKSVKVLFRIT